MSVEFIHPQTKISKVIPFGFNWISFFFSFWGVPCFIYGLIGKGIFLVILYSCYVLAILHGINGTRDDVYESGIAMLIIGGLIFLNSLYLGFATNRLRAYNLVGRGYLIKNADSPVIAEQLQKWKISASEIKNYQVNSTRQKASNSNLDELEKLAKLRDNNVISEDEFKKKKTELLGL